MNNTRAFFISAIAIALVMSSCSKQVEELASPVPTSTTTTTGTQISTEFIRDSNPQGEVTPIRKDEADAFSSRLDAIIPVVASPNE